MEEEFEGVGKIDATLLKNNYNIKTDKVIITKERIEHINKRHNDDYNLYGHLIQTIIADPDYILEDVENVDTLLYLKIIKNLNLQAIVKLQTKYAYDKVNTIITFWHMRKRSYNQIIRKNKKIYKKMSIIFENVSKIFKYKP